MNPFFLAQSGPLAGQRIELAAGTVTVGRDAGNTVVVPDQAVSRHHARVSVVNGAATLEDVGSSGGTFVNDVRIAAPTVLKVGDVVRMGGTTFAFMPGASVSPMGVTGTMPSRSGRRREVGSSERAQAPMPTPARLPSSSTGCMPDFSQLTRDVEGCLPMLLRFLVIAIIIIVIVSIIGGVIMLIGTLAAVPHAAPPAQTPPQSAPVSPHQPPPSQPNNQPPPQQQPPQPAAGSIKVVRVRTAYLPREGYAAPVPVALVTWQNVGSSGIVEVFADVTSYDRAGNVIGLQRGVRIYTGPTVPAGANHEDDEKSEGLILSLDQGKGRALDHATVSPTEVRVEAPPPDE